jgi:c(7)-type cytochrome triheme protein
MLSENKIQEGNGECGSVIQGRRWGVTEVRGAARQLYFLLALACWALLPGSETLGQVYLPPPPPADPGNYGKVILDKYSRPTPGAVVFDHWLHRAKFTCRLCHVDIGFAMKARETGIRAATNRQGFHCGSCHDGKRIINGKVVFAACSDVAHDRQCDRCHSDGKRGVREYEYKRFTAKFPKGVYGIDWEAAESAGIIKPMDFLEGISVKRSPMPSREDFTVKPAYSWVHPIRFSHEKHLAWNGCEVCHPDIFPTTKRGTIRYSMFFNIEGRFCGACHGRVAFPLNHCQGCHSAAPPWVQ